MDRLDRLRPNLAALLQQDLKAAREEPLESPHAAPPMVRPEVREAFADRIAHQHAVEGREVRTRPSAAAQIEEPLLLSHKRKRRPSQP